MRTNPCTYLAQQMEESSRREDSVFGRLFKFLLFPSLSDKLGYPLSFICNSPVICLVVILIVYLLFLIIFTPLWLLSFLITSYGSILTFLFLFQMLATFICRSISFPGSNNATIKSTSSDVLRRLAEYLENTAIATNEASSNLMLLASGRLSAESFYTISANLTSIWQAVEFFPNLLLYFQDSIDFCRKEKFFKDEEIRNLTQLCQVLQEFYENYQQLLSVIRNHNNNNNNNNRVGRSTQQQSSSSLLSFSAIFAPQTMATKELLTLAAQSVSLSERLCNCTGSTLKSRVNNASLTSHHRGNNNNNNTNDDDSILNMVKTFLSLSSGLTSYEKLAFPYLRSILRHKFAGEFLTIKGANDNMIDAVLLRSHRFQQQQQSSSSSVDRSTLNNNNNNNNHILTENEKSETVVLFCPPNAAFYECISQFNIDKSWFGFYLQQNQFDVISYNYRGYGRSTGYPRPSALRADSICIFEYIITQLQPKQVIIHGESIGGMIACHLAYYASQRTGNNNNNINNILC
jgi:hypothetical protein